MPILHDVWSGICAHSTVPSHRTCYGYHGPPQNGLVPEQSRALAQGVFKVRWSQQPVPRAVYMPVRPTESTIPATMAPTISSKQSAPEPGARRAPPNSVHLCSRVKHDLTAPLPLYPRSFWAEGVHWWGLKMSQAMRMDRKVPRAQEFIGSFECTARTLF